MISKELLSEVLGIEIYSCKLVAQTTIVRYKFDAVGEVRDSSINIHELAHKCKEWAFNKDMFILSSASLPRGKFTSSYCVAEKQFSYPTKKETFHANAEPEAIFKACQWILENKK